MASTLQELKSIGEQLGFKGVELQAFVKDQQDAERNERAAKRAIAEKEKDRAVEMVEKKGSCSGNRKTSHTGSSSRTR